MVRSVADRTFQPCFQPELEVLQTVQRAHCAPEVFDSSIAQSVALLEYDAKVPQT